MAQSSLDKFSVLLPESVNGSNNQRLLMPKLKYRFRVIFLNMASSNGVSPTDSYQITNQVISCSRPSVTMTGSVIDVYNSKINLAGKPVWGAIALKVRDDISNATSKLIARQLQTQFDFMEQASALAGQSYKFNMRVEILDGGNGAYAANIIDQWDCLGCFIESANWGQLQYSESGPVEIDLSIKMDNCVQYVTAADNKGHEYATGIVPGDNTAPWGGYVNSGLEAVQAYGTGTTPTTP